MAESKVSESLVIQMKDGPELEEPAGQAQISLLTNADQCSFK
jgi:hypothetical protein